MVSYYNIAGRQIGSHYLAITTLTTIFGVVGLSLGGSKAKKTDGPPLNAQSPDEEKFIQNFLKEADNGSSSKDGYVGNVAMGKGDAGR